MPAAGKSGIVRISALSSAGLNPSCGRFGLTGAQTCFLASQARIVANSRKPSTGQPVCVRFTSVGSAVQVRNAATSLAIWSTVASVPSA